MVSILRSSITWARLIVVICYAPYAYGLHRHRIPENEKTVLDDSLEESEDSLIDSQLQLLKRMNVEANRQLSELNKYDAFETNYLRNLLHVRVPGTVGHHIVKRFIIKKLRSSGWTVDLDTFSSPTPIGKKSFTNIVAYLPPLTDRHLALAAHYDSKLVSPKKGQYFLGATDSAVPCAMLLDFAKFMGGKWKKRNNGSADVSPLLIFLDGEEAFAEWTETDSLYGARHLAQKMANQPHHNKYLARKLVSMLDSLDAFVLLDLIGAKNPSFYDIYPSTSQLYSRLKDIESRLMQKGEISNERPYFKGEPAEYFQVEDDHEPFLRRGVPILHLIDVPFPKVWHKLTDNESALDGGTIVNLLTIFHYFLLDYFELR